MIIFLTDEEKEQHPVLAELNKRKNVIISYNVENVSSNRSFIDIRFTPTDEYIESYEDFFIYNI